MILAVDPGGTTGLAWNQHSSPNIVRSLQLGPNEHHSELWDFLTVYAPQHIVCESFTYRNGLAKADLIPVEYIGVIRLWAEKDVRPMTMQTPSMAKKFFDDKKVKAAGLWKPGMPHAMDAVRHLLYYITFTLKDERFLTNAR